MKTTLYRFYDCYGTLLYVGVTGNMSRRKSQHKAKADWFSRVAITKTEEVPSRKHALALEQVAIKFEKPLFNKPSGKVPTITPPKGTVEFQGPKAEFDELLSGFDHDRKRAALLMAQFLHLMPKDGRADQFCGIPPRRFLEVARMGRGPRVNDTPRVQRPYAIHEIPTPEASA